LQVPGYQVGLKRASLGLGLPRPNRCPAWAKCPPPLDSAAITVHLTIAGHEYSLRGSGQAPTVTLNHGARTLIVVSIDRPAALPVSNLYLSVNSYPSGSGPPGPIGREHTIMHDTGSLQSGSFARAEWTPTALFGTSNLDLTLEYSEAVATVSYVIAHLHVSN
jgi:hypothetical protein